MDFDTEVTKIGNSYYMHVPMKVIKRNDLINKNLKAKIEIAK